MEFIGEMTNSFLKFSFFFTDTKSTKYNQPNFTVKRTFTARNTGELPVEVRGFMIGDLPCQGYGFKVLDCRGFRLAPNDSHKVDIAFTPDFTLSKVHQRLIIYTSLGHLMQDLEGESDGQVMGSDASYSGQLEYGLQATVPANLLAQCGAAVPRPSWEPLVYYTIMTVLVAMLVGTVILAILDSEQILKTTFIAMTTLVPYDESIPVYDKSKVFNLRTIGSETKVRNGYVTGLEEKPYLGNRKNSFGSQNTNKKPISSQSLSNLNKNKSNKRNSDEWSFSRDGNNYDNLAIKNYLSSNKSNKNNKNPKTNVKKSLIDFFSRAIGKKEETDANNISSNQDKNSYLPKEDNNSSYRNEAEIHLMEQFNNNKSKRKNKQLSS